MTRKIPYGTIISTVEKGRQSVLSVQVEQPKSLSLLSPVRILSVHEIMHLVWLALLCAEGGEGGLLTTHIFSFHAFFHILFRLIFISAYWYRRVKIVQPTLVQRPNFPQTSQNTWVPTRKVQKDVLELLNDSLYSDDRRANYLTVMAPSAGKSKTIATKAALLVTEHKVGEEEG